MKTEECKCEALQNIIHPMCTSMTQFSFGMQQSSECRPLKWMILPQFKWGAAFYFDWSERARRDRESGLVRHDGGTSAGVA